jgi:UPF0042 nucleotide-binding protein
MSTALSSVVPVAGKKLNVVMVTGLAGAGLKTAINIFEDHSVYCIDNLPLETMSYTLQVVHAKKSDLGDTVVFGFHADRAEEVAAFFRVREEMQKMHQVSVLYITADMLTIEDRYGANRRKHPLLVGGESLREAIAKETQLLEPILHIADHVFDTSNTSPQQLARMIENTYFSVLGARKLYVSLISFGYKHGTVRPFDLMFDVRFLNNPFFSLELRNLTGLDTKVKDFVIKDPICQELLTMLVQWFQWVLPKYYDEGKHYLRVGIGCTGGQHRSVAIVEELTGRLQETIASNIVFSKNHRDLELN